MNAKINTRKIKARRVELDIKQKQMSEMLKCSTVTYSKKERGIVDFEGKELLMVSQVLKIPMEELYILPNTYRKR